MTGAERRIVSVLFADLVGFTSLTEKLEPEDIALIQDNYFQRVKDVVARHDGWIEKFIGDAVVAVFGLPVSREDDAERAVRAGLSIIRTIEKIGVDLSLESQLLNVRVGVNTGEVIFSQSNTDSNEWRVTGDTVNVAARLEGASRPGKVLIGAETALAVESSIELEQTDALALKGKSEPVKAWWAIQPRTDPSRQHALGMLRAPTVGRDIELKILRKALKITKKDAVRCLIVAPPGVGKSRLVNEFSKELACATRAKLWVTRTQTETSAGYDPIRNLLRKALNDAGFHKADRLNAERTLRTLLAKNERTGLHAQVVIEQSLDLAWPEGKLKKDEDRDTLFTSWVTALDALSEDKPAVWIVEDLHWANPDLIAFLEFGAKQPSKSGRLIITTARPSFFEAFPHWSTAEDRNLVIPLKNLAKTDAFNLIEELLGQDVLPDDISKEIAIKSEGNPLYVEELLRLWIGSGILLLHEGERWIFKGGVEEIRIPTTVQAIYSVQLDLLPQPLRQVIRYGSIAGRSFPGRALPQLGILNPDPVLVTLVKRLFVSGPHPDVFQGDCFTYRHAVLRDVAYASLPRADRARLHIRFAKWLQLQPDSSELAAELIGNQYHAALNNASTLTDNIGEGLGRSEVSSLAVKWLEQAAEIALRSAPQSATILLQRCLDLTPDDTIIDRLRLLYRLGEAFRRSGDLESAMVTFEKAAINSLAAENHSTLPFAVIGYEDALFASRLPRSIWGDKSVSLLIATLEALSEQDSGIRSRLLAALGRSQAYGSTPQKGLHNSVKAVEMARRVSDHSSLAYALLALRSSHMEPDKLEQRLKEITELVHAAQRSGDKEMELEGQRLRFLDLLEMGRIAEAHTVRKQAVLLIEELRRPMYFWYPPMWNSMFALLEGSFDEAEVMIEHFRDEGERWNYKDVKLVYVMQLFQLYMDQGFAEMAKEVIEKNILQNAYRWDPALCLIYADFGLRDQVRSMFDNYAPDFTGFPKDLSWAHVICLFSETCAYLEDREVAAVLYSLLLPWANHNIVIGSGALGIGSASLFLGLLSKTMNDNTLAIGHFKDAISMNDRMGAQPAAIRSRLELVRILCQKGEKPEELIQEVHSMARKKGMQKIIKQTEQLITQ